MYLKNSNLFWLKYSKIFAYAYDIFSAGKKKDFFLIGSDFCLTHQEVFKPEPLNYCTDFTSTAIATVSTYGRDICQLGTLVQAVRVVLDSHPLNTNHYPQPTRATLPDHNPFAGKYHTVASFPSQYLIIRNFAGL
ncbi:hypothetical protein RF11_04704 [Thelohanellus kitauei]|uniref:Uncharacterized protein n=1 Tax=Thelohanellus kitauei TaxID=669202 RepID=A0A0C2NH31_THEKT|nr:hypothetical protein RF11_04704 [Thelohanellus kitauei]